MAMTTRLCDISVDWLLVQSSQVTDDLGMGWGGHRVWHFQGLCTLRHQAGVSPHDGQWLPSYVPYV